MIRPLLHLLFISVICMLQGCFKTLPEFEVYGDKEILNHLVINMVTYNRSEKDSAHWIASAQSIIYKGKWNRIYENNDMGGTSFYFSYEGKVANLITDAFFLNQKLNIKHDANIFYASKNGSDVLIKYYKSRADYNSNHEPIEVVISLSKHNFIKNKNQNKNNTEDNLKYYFGYFPINANVKN